MSAPALAQTSPALAWDESDTSTVSGYAVAIDGTRTDYGLTPAGSGGACGCSIAVPFSGGSHTIVVSAYNSSGEAAAPALTVGPRANPGGPYSGQLGVAVPVSGASSTDTSAGTLTSYQWQWGDGSSTTASPSASASHVYPTEGAYVVTLTVVDNAGATNSATTSAAISAPPPPPPPTLPSPWQQTDVGTVGPNGSASYASGTWTVNGGGADVSGPADSFSYVYQSLTGDGRIIARVVGLSNTNANAKAGIMLRETLAPDSRHVTLDLEPNGGIEVIARSMSGGNGTVVATTTSAPPVWVELTRTAGAFSAAISADSVTWSQVGSASISMASTLDVGLIVCSHDTTVSNTSTFDSVTVEQGTFTVPPAEPSAPSPSDGATGVAASPTLTWTANGANTYDVKFGATNPPPQVSGGQSASSFSTGSLAMSTKYYWQVVAHNGAGATLGPVWSFTTAGTQEGGGSLPAPWTSEDIGATGPAAAPSYSSGTFTVPGTGADIGGTSDAFRYVNQPLKGDLEIVARVVSLQNANTSAKAGLMMRGSTASGAADVVLDVTPTGSVEFVTRPSDGAATTYLAGASQSLPAWLKLSSAGGTVTGYVSRDGAAWTQVGSTKTSLPSDALMGLVVTSHDSTQAATAVFDSVNVKAAGTPPVTSASEDVVIYASDAHRWLPGSWRATRSSSSPKGIMLATLDLGVAHPNAPLATLTDYVDFTFTANAGIPYAIWMRLRASKNSAFNDSLWVQFSDARANGSPIYAMNTTSGLLENLATDSSGHGLSGWGWVNGAYWLSQATTVTFATSGLHTVRVQVREDGVEFDQIVLSPSTYLTAAPGTSARDSTIVPR